MSTEMDAKICKVVDMMGGATSVEEAAQALEETGGDVGCALLKLGVKKKPATDLKRVSHKSIKTPRHMQEEEDESTDKPGARREADLEYASCASTSRHRGKSYRREDLKHSPTLENDVTHTSDIASRPSPSMYSRTTLCQGQARRPGAEAVGGLNAGVTAIDISQDDVSSRRQLVVAAEIAPGEYDIEAEIDARVREQTEMIEAQVQQRIIGEAVQADVMDPKFGTGVCGLLVGSLSLLSSLGSQWLWLLSLSPKMTNLRPVHPLFRTRPRNQQHLPRLCYRAALPL